MNSNLSEAQLFRTGTATGGYTLNYIQLLISGVSGQPSGFSILLYAEDPGQAGYLGTFLGRLTGVTTPSTAGIYIYTAENISLSPYTAYWVMATSTTIDSVSLGLASNAYDQMPSDGWLLSPTEYYNLAENSGWKAARGYYYQMAIYATAVPAHSIISLVFICSGVWIGSRSRRKTSNLWSGKPA